MVVSPLDEDIEGLERLLRTSHAEARPLRWDVTRPRTPESTIDDLKANPVPVLVCECDAVPNAWRKLVCEIPTLAHPPLLIVISRLADDRLWAEALNLGAWDVLAKPLDSQEVNRVLYTALLHWHDRYYSSTAVREAQSKTETVSTNAASLRSSYPRRALAEPETA
jgi:DNA-binding NtrC family response regulator